MKKSDYTYSNSNQLLKLVERMFDGDNKEIARKTTKYSYDSNGNQLKQSISHTLPDNTGLRPKTTGTAYGDNVSNTIDKLVEKTSYTYDGFNRLKKTETVKAGVRTTVDFTYNGDDLRVNKSVKKSDKGYIAEVTNYLYDRQNVILETDASGNVKTRYIKGINYIAKADASGKESYFLFNGHGDVVQTVDDAGTVQNQYDYDIWGNPTLTVETTGNAIRYTGEFYDEESGLYYLRARYYDPNLGRFTTEDSYWGEDGNPLSLNRYTYCHNDPIQYVDPTGHMSANELDFFFGKGASQLFDDKGNYKKGTVPMMVEGIGVITNVDCSKALDERKYGYTIMTPDTKVYGNIDNYSNIDVINTAAGSSSSITNHDGYSIGTINVSAGSRASINIGTGRTTVNNMGFIETLITGKGSSLLLYNYGRINDIAIGENGTADIYNYNYIKNITGGDITDDRKKGKIGMYIENRGTIGHVLTGKESENVINNFDEYGGKLTLQTGKGNKTIIINGEKGVSIENGEGKAVYRLYSPEGKIEEVDVNDTNRLQLLIAIGCHFKSNNSIIVNGKEYVLFIPKYSNGTNSNINEGNWKTVDTKEVEFKYTNGLSAFFDFLAGIGNNMINATAEGTVTTIDQKDITYKNGSDKGTLTLDSSNEKMSGGFGLLLDALIGATTSLKNNTHKNMLK